ncbi:MAG: thiol reductant ABC exporter subunit CydD [Caulobacteraceae bacterium]|nr:thiol reductant ABC exporter subunit CydD [Caulobacteraceae bacterium]
MDSLAAIGFAAGLALAIGRLPLGWQAAVPGALLAVASVCARGLLARTAIGAASRQAAEVKQAVRRRVFAAALAREGREPSSLGSALSVAVDAVEALDGWYVRYAPARTAAVASPLVVVVAMALASPVCALIVAATFVPFVIAMALAGGAAAHEARRQFESMARLSGRFADRLRALPAILAFDGAARAGEELQIVSEELAERTLKVLRIAFVSSAALEFFAALSVALVAVYCGFGLLGLLPFRPPERLDLVRAVFVLVLAPEAYLPMRRLAQAYHERETAEAVAEVVRPLADEPSAPGRAGSAEPPAVRFDGVSLAYSDSDASVLDGFDLDVRPGEFVALVGPSGSGKTTVLRLALGLIQPSGGRVTLDGRDAAPGGAAWVGQSPVVTPGSLAENIRLARTDVSDAEVARAAALAGLPADSLDRPVDERGGGLSGGERRRLALARAFLANASLVLLDEPTADLDAASEAEAIQAIAGLARGRTTLVATHNAALAAMADRIVRLAA